MATVISLWSASAYQDILDCCAKLVSFYINSALLIDFGFGGHFTEANIYVEIIIEQKYAQRHKNTVCSFHSQTTAGRLFNTTGER